MCKWAVVDSFPLSIITFWYLCKLYMYQNSCNYFSDSYSKLMLWWFSITRTKASIRNGTFLFYTPDCIFWISKVFSTNPFLFKSSKPTIILLKCSINQFRLLFYDSTRATTITCEIVHLALSMIIPWQLHLQNHTKFLLVGDAHNLFLHSKFGTVLVHTAKGCRVWTCIFRPHLMECF